MMRLSENKLAQTMKKRRSALKITQQELAEATDINRAMIGRIEREEYIPSIPQLEAIAENMKFDFIDVFADDERPAFVMAMRGKNLDAKERGGVNALLKMMLAAKQQIIMSGTLEK